VSKCDGLRCEGCDDGIPPRLVHHGARDQRQRAMYSFSPVL
jgi:hypothetical protein